MAGILVVHEQAALRQLLVDAARLTGNPVASAIDVRQARLATRGARTDYALVVIGTHRRPRASDAVDELRRTWPAAAVVVVGDPTDLGDVTAAMRHGAFDYLPPPPAADAIVDVLRAALEGTRGGQRPHLGHSDASLEEAVTADPATREVFASASRAAAVNSTVLITGESGTGKEILARRIHQQSARSRCKFVPVNCGSLPETLIESELFGHKRGAFTGAMHR